MSIYKLAKEGTKALVKDASGAVCLECFPGKRGTEGLDPKVADEQASKGHWSEDTNFMRHAAYWAIKKTRSALPYGPFNNTMLVGGKPRYLTPTKKLSKAHAQVDCQLAPRVLVSAAESFFARLGANREDLIQMAVRGFGAQLVKGGVCSLISHVTMGFITTGFPDGAEAALVYSGFDHSFCIARYKSSPWVPVDPWVMRPYALPMQNCLFDFDSIQSNYRFVIRKKVDVPYGVTFGGAEPVAKDELRIPDDAWRAAADWAGIRPDPGSYSDESYRPVSDVEKDLQILLSGASAAEKGRRAPWFHTDHVWHHRDNLWWPRGKKWGKGGTCNAEAVGPYRQPSCPADCCDDGDPELTDGSLDDVSPAAGPEDWGDPKGWKAVKKMRQYLDAGE